MNQSAFFLNFKSHGGLFFLKITSLYPEHEFRLN
jgi:hypothetical protein